MADRPTAAQLAAAALAMDLAAGTVEHDARTSQHQTLHDVAGPWTRAVAACRVAWWQATNRGWPA